MSGGDFGFFTGQIGAGQGQPREVAAGPVGISDSAHAWQRWDDKFDALFRWRRLGGWRWVLLGTVGLAVVLFGWGLLATPGYGRSRVGNAFGAALSTLFTGGLIGGIGGFVHCRPRRSGKRTLRQAAQSTPGMHTCHYLGGAGLPFTAGVVYRLGLGHDHLRIALPTGQVVLDVPYSEVVEATAYGKGQVTTGAGFIGGGFGLQGAAEGMLIAAALNSLSQKTTVHSFVRLVTSTGEGVFALAESLPQQLDIELARLRVYRRSSSAVPAALGPTPGSETSAVALPSRAVPAADRLEMLERLGQLRRTGVLSEEEFEAQKRLLLG